MRQSLTAEYDTDMGIWLISGTLSNPEKFSLVLHGLPTKISPENDVGKWCHINPSTLKLWS